MTQSLLTPHQSQYVAWLLTRRVAATSPMFEEKLSWQKKQREPEGKRNKLCRELFGRQDEVKAQRDILIECLKQKLRQQVGERPLFTVEWELS